MAKRFTDTGKWDKAWYRKLPPRLKCAWDYLCDRCDHAGIWNIDTEALAFNVGEPVSLQELIDRFSIEVVDEDKIIVPGFVEFQYNCSVEELNPSNKVHLSVLQRLKKVAPNKPLPSPIQGAKDKDKEKDKEKEKEKEGGVGETRAPASATLPPSEFVHEPQPLDPEDLDLCYQAWLETLAFYKASRQKLLPGEQIEIVRAVQRHGNSKAVLYALRGARHEPKNEKFNPADFLKINRVLDPEQFNRFMNLGIRAEHRKAEGA